MSICVDGLRLKYTSTSIRPHRGTYSRYRIDTVNSPDDGYTVARNMYRIDVNIHEKSVRQFGLFKTKVEDAHKSQTMPTGT